MTTDGEAATTDIIRLVGLGGSGRHGVLPEERQAGQLFTVDVTMHVDTRAAAQQDDLRLTVDYAAVARDVVDIIEGDPVDLVETLAQRIADAVLARPAVERVEVTVHKPEAPVGVPFSDVQVSIRRDRAGAAAPVAEGVPAAAAPMPAVVEPEAPEPEPEPAAEPEPARGVDLDAEPEEPVDVVLGLGGNVGDVRATLRRAIDDLASSGVLEVVGVAPLAKTAAVLQPDAVAQPDYLNTVVVARTSASPRRVLEVAHAIEAAHGRSRDKRWGERTLDIDVITYGTVASSDPELSLPHPRANERAFVLVPWAHLDPDAFLPGLGGGPVAALADTAPDRDGVRWLALDWYQPGPPGAPVAPPAPPEDVSTSRVRRESEPEPVEPEAAPVEQAPAAAAADVEPAPDEPAEPVEPVAPVEPDPESQLEPEPDGSPFAPPVPDAFPVPQPDAVPQPAPSQVPQPEPTPEPQPSPVPQPQPVPEPQPSPVPQPEPMPQPEPLPQPEPPVAPQPSSPPRAPWDGGEESTQTRIRPRWAPVRRDDADG